MKFASCLLSPVLLALPLAASATIYRWTDEGGTMVFSNLPPAADANVANVQVVAEDDEPAAAPQAPAAPKPDNGNALQERIRALEQQVQTLQTQPSSYLAPDSARLPPTMNQYGDHYYSYTFPLYAYPPYSVPFVVVAPSDLVRPAHAFGGFHFGVQPVPLTHIVGITYRH